MQTRSHCGRSAVGLVDKGADGQVVVVQGTVDMRNNCAMLPDVAGLVDEDHLPS